MALRPGYKQSEVGSIPADWETVCLADVSAFITKGATPTTYGFGWESDGVLFLRSECVSAEGLDLAQSMNISAEANRALRRSTVRADDLLITITGNVGRVVRLPRSISEANINQHIARIRVVDSSVDAGWVYYFLTQPHIRRHFESITTGQAYPQISLVQVRNAIVSRPSIAEQSAIATALSDVDELLGGLDRLIAKKRDLKQAAMQQLLTGHTRLPGFHGEWEVKRLGDVAEMSSGGTPLSSVAAYYDGDIPWVSIADMTKGGRTISGTERNLTAIGLSNSATQMFPAGTVLYAMYASIGECSIAGIPLCTSQAILGIRPREKLRADFLYYFLVSLKGKVKSLGQQGTQANLNKGMVQDFSIGLPAVDEQTAIAAVLSDMDAELAALEARRDKTRALKQGMMQELLTGRTRLV